MKELGIDAAGKISAGQLAEPGRALGRLTDIGWGGTLRALLSEQTPDGPVTGQLADAMVQVLASWDWKQRPAAVVAMPSRTRPTLITSLGQRIVPDDLRDALSSHREGPVLLVDDQIDTGWTMTVAAMLLRDAGAPGVLPLALAVATG
jgi:ATP-dependent DNA helicase RecQ